jgi:hypothetical protein
MKSAFAALFDCSRDQTIANKEACDDTITLSNPFSIRKTRCGTWSSN